MSSRLHSPWRPLRFALVALALTWLGWLPLLLRPRGVSVPGGQAWHLFGSLGPLVSAFVVVAIEHGRPGCRALAGSIVKWPGRRPRVRPARFDARPLVALTIREGFACGQKPPIFRAPPMVRPLAPLLLSDVMSTPRTTR